MKLSLVEYLICGTILDFSATGREIASFLNQNKVFSKIPYGTLYTTLRRLRKRELVKMNSSREDGRLRFFTLTEKGRDVFRDDSIIYDKLARM